ncbi:MAG: RagB/SusD family nutrient uptake outer membrane protein [Chitinophagaceae bacterium]|jgi:tetratricopeptide (TPR) repeat protein|nr:RagB/SusD family nutrient uptake outer membrane protein [Chitinophagaceae bacterium]
MNKIRNIILAGMLFSTLSCTKSFLEQNLQGQLTLNQVSSTQGVENLLIGAYGLMNGNINGTWGNYASAPTQWLFGDVAADNAHKGSISTDIVTMTDIERHTPISVNDNLSTMWRNYYEGIIRCNNTLVALAAVQSGSGNKFSDARAKQIEAEAKMLRAHYYFFLYRIFKNIPYIDETIASTQAAIDTPNDKDVLPMIITDLQFAVANLPLTPPLGDVGRSTKLAAEAYLGKVYLYQKNYPDALTLFKDVIANKPSLTTMQFSDNFNIQTKNGPEGIFVVQDIINPDGGGDNANVGEMLSGLYGSAPVNCCGFNQPSFDLVNAFRVDADGLPLSTSDYRTKPYVSDFGLAGAAKDNYKVDQTIAFDPRLDYTVGRRGVPYRDWGVMPGDGWLRAPAFAGPFAGMKFMINKADFPGNTQNGALYVTSTNVNIIRLADVYLMAAECAVETNDIPSALGWVNAVRNRAAKLPAVMIGSTPAAAYSVKPYPSFPNADYARNAIRTERRIELAMEGHRFFDILRWGIAKQTIESYSKFEGTYLPNNANITFDDSKGAYWPIPQEQIDRSNGSLKQNAGY